MKQSTRFDSAELEREYQAHLVPEKIRLTRMLAVLGIGLNLCFIVLDFWAIPSALTAVWAWRAAIVVALVAVYTFTSLPAFPRHYNMAIVLPFVVMAAGINAMILLAGPGEAAVDQYFGGLLLLIIGLHTLAYLSPWLAGAMSLAMLGAYAAVVILGHDYSHGSGLIVMIANLFVGASAATIGVVAQTLRDGYVRENYLLRHSLQRDVKIKEEEKRRASYLAEHDPLTGLPNRLQFEEHAESAMARVRREGACLALIFIDLDGFKPVNDTHGHDVGDRVLRLVGERLRNAVRNGDLCARYGGDEFIVAVTAEHTDTLAVPRTAERLAAAIEKPIGIRGAEISLSASIGVAGFPFDGQEIDHLVSIADRRMYEIKNSGKSGIALPPAWANVQPEPPNVAGPPAGAARGTALPAPRASERRHPLVKSPQSTGRRR